MNNKTKIRYLLSYPYIMQFGGASLFIQDTVKKLSEFGWNIQVFEPLSEVIDYEILIVYGNTYLSPEVLGFIKSKGVKVILVPIFDRNKALWKMKLLKFSRYLPFLTIQKLRELIFGSSSKIVVHNNSEFRDLNQIYNVSQDKMKMIHIPVNPEIFTLDKTITKKLFVSKYGWDNFVFCPAATISKRKNQLTLIKALKGTGVKLVLNNTQSINDGLKEEFDNLVKNDPDILCLEKLDFDMLVSAYKAAKVSVSVSQSETAGLVNLEAGYLGCNLVVSDLESLREYLKDYPIFVDQNNPEQIKQAVLKALKQDYNPEIKDFIKSEYTWENYISSFTHLF